MTNFVIIYSGGTVPQEEAEQQAVMAAWGAWYGKMGDAIVDGGNPFSMSKSITAAGVSDGPVSSPPATGYTVIKADSLDAAVALCSDHPHTNYGGQLSVYETFRM